MQYCDPAPVLTGLHVRTGFGRLGAVSPINMSGVHSSRLMAVPKLLLLCVVLLDIPFQVSIHAARQEAIEELGAISGFEISLGSIALALLCLIVVIGPGFTRPRAFDKTVVTPAFLLLVIYVFSVLVAKDSLVALFEVWKVAGLFCLCWYVTHTVASREDFLFVVRWLLLGLIFESVLMLGQAGGWVGSFTLWGLKVRDDFLGSGRICGSLASPNEAAPYLAMIMTLALSVLRAKVRRSDKFLAAAGLSVAIIPLIATGSRGGWLAFVVGAIIVVLFGGKRHRIRTAAALIVMLIAIGAPLANVLQDRLTRDDSGSAASRVPLNRIALLMIADYPILGVGANNFPLVMAPYAVRCHAMGEFLYTVHNKYLLVWSELGSLGFVAFMWLLIAIVYTGVRCANTRHPLYSPLALGLTAAAVGVMAHMLFDPFRENGAYRLLWLIGGLLGAMTSGVRNGTLQMSFLSSSGVLYEERPSVSTQSAPSITLR